MLTATKKQIFNATTPHEIQHDKRDEAREPEGEDPIQEPGPLFDDNDVHMGERHEEPVQVMGHDSEFVKIINTASDVRTLVEEKQEEFPRENDGVAPELEVTADISARPSVSPTQTLVVPEAEKTFDNEHGEGCKLRYACHKQNDKEDDECSEQGAPDIDGGNEKKT